MEVPIGSFQIVVTVVAISVTALVIVRWKPSERSRSLSGISALSAQPARIVARSGDWAHCVRRERTSPFQSARDDVCGIGYRAIHVETTCETIFSLAD